MITILLCIAEAIYFEARNQPQEGQLAVAQVILNRTRHPDYPDNPCDVVRQGKYIGTHPLRHKCQFTYYCDGLKETIKDKPAFGTAFINAAAVYFGLPDTTGGATHYHADYARPYWSAEMEYLTRIEGHLFYK